MAGGGEGRGGGGEVQGKEAPREGRKEVERGTIALVNTNEKEASSRRLSQQHVSNTGSSFSLQRQQQRDSFISSQVPNEQVFATGSDHNPALGHLRRSSSTTFASATSTIGANNDAISVSTFVSRSPPPLPPRASNKNEATATGVTKTLFDKL